MKKTLHVVLAVILAFAMIGGFAFVATPTSSGEYQISLASVKAVDVQDSTVGVRSYSDLVETTRMYQVNDVIYIAVTAEVKNIESSGNRSLTSISGKEIDVVVGSSNVDLSYAKYSSPVLLAHIWSGYSQANVATLGYVMSAGEVLTYDSATNEVTWTYKGYDQYAMTTTSTSVNLNLVVFNPSVDSDGNIMIPALKLKKQEATWQLGTSTFNTTYEAPTSVAYTMVLTGVTKANDGATTGSFYAKILVSGAEKFEDFKTYYVNSDTGTWTETEPSGTEYVDYVAVEVEYLEMTSGYNVYKYFVPGYATSTSTPIVYFGDDDDYDEKTLANVNPNLYDNATNKTTFTAAGLSGTTELSVAGGVKTQKDVYEYYTTSSNQLTVPLSSVVYTTYNKYYAPGFYGGTYSSATTGSGRTHNATQVADEVSFSVAGPTVTLVDTYWVDLTDAERLTFNTSKLRFYRADATGIYDAASNFGGSGTYDHNLNAVVGGTDVDSIGSGNTPWQVGGGSSGSEASPYEASAFPYYSGSSGLFNFTVEWATSSLAGHVRLIVRVSDTSSAYPLTAAPDGTNQWIVYYNSDSQTKLYTELPHYDWYWQAGDTMPTVTAATDAYYHAPVAVAATDAPTEAEYYPVLAETYKTGSGGSGGDVGFQVSNLKPETLSEYVSAADLASAADITNIYWGLKDSSGYISGFSIQDNITLVDGTNGWPTSVTANSYGFALGYTSIDVSTDSNGRPVVTVGGLSIYDSSTSTWSTINATTAGYLLSAVKAAIATVSSSAGVATAGATEFVLSLSITGISSVSGSWSGGAGLDEYVIGRNGIATYVICTTDDEPLVALATESTYFESDNGYGIAMFDANNLDSLATRIFRANSTNLTYTGTGTYVTGSTAMIRGLNYFGLDSSFGTTYKVLDDDFESKAGAAVYSENLTGSFKYGTISEIEIEGLDEDTPITEVEEDEDVDVEDEVEEEDIPEETPEPTTQPSTRVPSTGDASVNVAFVLAVAAVIAAAGLVFVMKKVR